MTLLTNPNKDLELDSAQFNDMVGTITSYLGDFLAGIDDQPTNNEPTGQVSLASTFVEGSTDLDCILDELFQNVVPSGYNTTSPGFLGFFGGGGIPQAAAADLISGVVNRFTGRWASAPAAVELELAVTRWLTDMVGYSETSLGILTSGGSQSNLISIFTARENQLKVNELHKARMYVSDQVHFSIRIAAKICGLPADAIREVPSDDLGRMNTEELDKYIQEDKVQGYKPFLVVATAGTFTTGAIDDIQSIASIANKERIWLHLDAAYGGLFALTEAGKILLSGIEKCDSITLDPHKSLFIPYGTGTLLVKDRDKLKDAHEIVADFYGPLQDDQGSVDICSYTFEQTREWRGLRIWLPLKLHGVAPFRINLQEKMQIAQHAAEMLAFIPGIEIMAAPTLTVLVFRLVTAGANEVELTELNQRFVKLINQKDTIFIMGTDINSKYGIRMCVLSFRTHLDRVQAGIQDIRNIAETLLSEYQ